MEGNSVAEVAGTHLGALPFTGLDGSPSQSTLVLVIYASLWTGAIGWEMLLSSPFDYRLAKETKWRSPLSALHSTSYYLSRYTTLVFAALFLHQASANPTKCKVTVVSTAAVFSVSLCCINLSFLLRTIAIWNMRLTVIVPLTISWLVIVGFAIALPAKTHAQNVDGVCLRALPDFYVGALFVGVFIFASLVLYFTVRKLHRQGWKALPRALLPQSKPNVDSDDVNVMLVQRTTAFFAMQLVIIVVMVVLYYLPLDANYRIMNFVAFKAITSSMAGRLFRKSWRLTRDIDSGNLNRPPSYYPGWAEDTEGGGRRMCTQSPPTSCLLKRPGEDDDKKSSYIEGEFYSTQEFKSTILASRTPAQMLADRHAASEKKSAREEGEEVPETVVEIEPGTTRGADADSIAPAGGSTSLSATNDPTAPLARPRKHHRSSNSYRSKGVTRPKTDPEQIAVRKANMQRISRIQEKRPSTMPTTISSDDPIQIVEAKEGEEEGEGEGEGVKSDDQDAQHRQRESPGVSAILTREDLNQTPARSKLWTDSRAERHRMEGAASGRSSPLIAESVAPPSSNVGTSFLTSTSYSPKHAGQALEQRLTGADKRTILDNANEAGEALQGQAWRFADEKKSPSFTSAIPKESFLRSSIADQSLKSDRRRTPGAPSRVLSKTILERPQTRQGSPLSGYGSPDERISQNTALRRPQDSTRSNLNATRPMTASSRPSKGHIVPQEETSRECLSAPNALDAFLQVIEDDTAARKNGVEELARPRTSRGSLVSALGQQRTRTDENDAFGLGASGQDATSDDHQRPTTSHGGSDLKPFGFQKNASPPLSAIEEQYRKLAAYVDGDVGDSQKVELYRLDSIGSMEHSS
ncbi:hypothetical protein CBS101457_002705 [Exobasidium rhododendri]|nr:hypothetical protein CBS101457_002705 [Exobasidium rhododendri]